MLRDIMTSPDGRKVAYLVTPGGPPEQGIPSMPPSIDEIPWDAVKNEIHNLLVDEQILTWKDLQAAEIHKFLNPLRRALIHLYKRTF